MPKRLGKDGRKNELKGNRKEIGKFQPKMLMSVSCVPTFPVSYQKE